MRHVERKTETESERDHTLRSKSVSVAGIVAEENFSESTMAEKNEEGGRRGDVSR